MIIDQLPNIPLPVLGTDEMPVERGQYTYKAAFEDISTTIKNGLDAIRPNLLDNWYFMSGEYPGLPINSRNKSTYNIPPAARTYTIDRWFVFDRGGDGTFKIYSNGIQLNRSGSTVEFGQFLEPVLLGETVTISVLAENNSRLSSGTGVVANNAVLIDDTYLTASFTRENAMTILHLIFKSSSPLVTAAKLEIGDSQTLAHQVNGTWVLNELPNYEEQLTRCMVSRADPSDAYANNVISYNAPNPNLLDNWYFVGGGSQQGGGQFPINQRGQTAYANTTSNKYSIDRWYYSRGKIAIDSSGLTLSWDGTNGVNGYMQNRTEHRLGGKVLTASILFSDGTLITGTTTQTTTANASTTYYNANGHEIRCTTFGADNTVSFVYLTTLTSGKKIAAIKLELGTTQTLAHQENGTWVLNELPNFAEELARCQRYFERLKGAYAHFGTGFANSATNAIIYVPIRLKAKTPTTTLNGTIYIWQPGKIGASASACTSISASDMPNGDNMLYLSLTSSNMTNAAPCGVQFRDTTSYIDVSADF